MTSSRSAAQAAAYRIDGYVSAGQSCGSAGDGEVNAFFR